jgi:hypothetical protein
MKSVSSIKISALFEYKFEKLPSKLRPWYKYAMDFVKVTRQKTPRIIYANNLLKCYFMENDPLNTLEIEYSGQNKVKALYHKGSEQMTLTYKDRCGDQATTFEFNIHSDFD